MSQPISMPWSAPMFPPPPHSWQGVRSALVPFTPDEVNLTRILPPGIEAEPGLGSIVLLSYPQSDIIHPFNECVVIVPVRVGDVVGNYVPYIYVTTDEALIPGREIGGFPKKIANVEWERDGDAFRASVTRFDELILAVEGTIAGPMPEEFAALQAEVSSRPSINYKLIPGPAGEIEIEEITATPIVIEAHEVEIGTATLKTNFVAADPVADLVPSTEGMLAVLRSDNTIPAGRVLERIERSVTA
ncbi:MAG: acetoacetate decarboxylase family protein [Acidimicrobiia bacterium]|nr:acetoacetate decarboxylase family protein [Acidimicrobiia bacterium]